MASAACHASFKILMALRKSVFAILLALMISGGSFNLNYLAEMFFLSV